jgi:CBS domain containing-hemolysin-like protein
MFVIIVICLLLLGLLTMFMNGVVASFTQEQYNFIIETNPNSIIKKIWQQYDAIIYSLLAIDAILVLFALFIYGVSESTTAPLQFIIFAKAFMLIVIVIIAHLFTFYLGKRLSEKLLLKWSRMIYIVAMPLVPLTKRFLSVVIKISGKEKDDITIEEITDLFEEAREEGSLDDEEYRLLKNVMNFNDVLVSDVMTPRIVLFSCEANVTVAEAIEMPELQMYSRFPIWEGDSLDDEILGYVTTKEIFSAALSGKLDSKLKSFSRKISFIPENSELGKTLETFLVNKHQLSLVVDEYGGVEGLITMEDIIETMLGVEIVDEADKVVDLRVLAKKRREIRLRENYNFEE